MELEERPYTIDGYPVSRREVMDQANMIERKQIYTIDLAIRVLTDDGREVLKVKK